jgi:hypothetical protein
MDAPSPNGHDGRDARGRFTRQRTNGGFATMSDSAHILPLATWTPASQCSKPSYFSTTFGSTSVQ